MIKEKQVVVHAELKKSDTPQSIRMGVRSCFGTFTGHRPSAADHPIKL